MNKKISTVEVVETDIFGLCNKLHDAMFYIKEKTKGATDANPVSFGDIEYYEQEKYEEEDNNNIRRSRLHELALSLLYKQGETILKELKSIKKLVKAAK